MKQCAKCKQSKSLDQFGKRSAAKDGLHPYCKPCHRESSKQSYHKDIERSRARDRGRNEKRKDYLAKKNAEWIANNKERHLQNSRNWHKNNKERVIRRNAARYKALYGKDLAYTADRLIRRQVQRIYDAASSKKDISSKEIGYTTTDFLVHIESLMQEGMSWENYGEWHIDHIKPISVYIKEGITDPIIINALDNLRPLWKAENLSKGASYECR